MKSRNWEQVNLSGSCIHVFRLSGFIVELVEHCTSIAELMGLNTVEAASKFQVSKGDNIIA